MTITETSPTVTNCPTWCSIEHEQQMRRLENERFPEDREPWHFHQFAQGVETDTHGPLYEVSLERGSNETKLYVSLESVNLTACQAEVLGLALLRAANVLRTCEDAVTKVKLANYWDGSDWVMPEPAALGVTNAEIALNAL